MIHGLANGVWLDDKSLRPIFAEAERLGRPVLAQQRDAAAQG
jgi:predicted TIM-barrel fold metal-dependent hydrolase